jgi:hypothetical protein
MNTLKEDVIHVSGQVAREVYNFGDGGRALLKHSHSLRWHCVIMNDIMTLAFM